MNRAKNILTHICTTAQYINLHTLYTVCAFSELPKTQSSTCTRTHTHTHACTHTHLSSPVASFLLSDWGSFPFDLLLVHPSMNCNPILGVILLHRCLVFTYSCLQCSSCLSNVHTQVILAWHLVDYTVPSSSCLVWVVSPALESFWGCLQSSSRFSLPVVATSSWFIHWLFWHTEGVGAWGCITFYSGVGWCWSASQVSLHYGFGIAMAIGSEHLSQVLDLLPLFSPSQAFLALSLKCCTTHLNTLTGRWEWKFNYLSVCVSFGRQMSGQLSLSSTPGHQRM